LYKVLLITNLLEDFPSGGREMLCKMNSDALREIYGEHCFLCELPKHSFAGLKSTVYAFKGYIDGLCSESIELLIQTITAKGIDKVFVDGSNFGEVVRVIKVKLPEVKVYTFFHNAEARFFWGALKQSRSPRALAVLMVNYLAERKAVRYSDKIICLSERDSWLLKQIYGRSATDISAMALHDKLSEVPLPAVVEKERFVLFVGGAFYANRVGITWFVKHVAPHIHIKTCIVGRGFEKFKDELEIDGKVVVVGAVESLEQWYLDAYLVIAPIFDGSGMKTKVAEALMYGKKIIGTPEAFSGYDDISGRVGCMCRTANEFITAIESAETMVHGVFDVELRNIYEEKHSFEAAKLRIERVLSL